MSESRQPDIINADFLLKETLPASTVDKTSISSRLKVKFHKAFSIKLSTLHAINEGPIVMINAVYSQKKYFEKEGYNIATSL